jgi:hypothetical protein
MFGRNLKLGGTEKLIVFAILGFIAYMELPSIVSAVHTMITELTSAMEAIALPAAIGGGLVGALLAISPWHRDHSKRFFSGGALAAIGGGLVPSLFTWLSGHVPSLATDGLTTLGAIARAVGL